mmetsp:Transcript_18679/g.22378  ORF Transcript_18679/g.22378 Transcript_18679/m.22378 type:complete len:297 (-) Transcript_18679:553-1443(-)|eukprot:CAMPEP_0197848758 /NCGR_PEP_ID=MMETSP1438-20131217/9925_1 /TAXON_ID=1461541 /ORGANISM="Pterosperma sp., Strain CCMP1384" /LENGTH=296 /DNA_ID=CAMNT_0043461155 /DNA_START=213 /DNA_END=1103 /DNA_ORIENTATION=+
MGDREKEDKLKNIMLFLPPGNRKFIVMGCVTFFLCAIYVLTRERHSFEDVSLQHLYEGKYNELQSVLGQRESALNETYQVLKKTYEANRKQEETIIEYEHQLKGCQADLSEAKKNAHHVDASALVAQSVEDKDRSEASIAMCRQEAAAALQDKENVIWQYQQALERAKEDVEELQKAVRQREGLLREKELSNQEFVAETHRTMARLEAKLEEADGSLQWMIEKKREDNERHAEQLNDAKTERSCHGDIEILREELNKAVQKSTDMALDKENEEIAKLQKKEMKGQSKKSKEEKSKN